MTNTLVSENIEKLQNYSLIFGATHTEKRNLATLVMRQTKRSTMLLGTKMGLRLHTNYLTGEILVCVSKPSVNILDNYSNISELPDGSLICKAFYETTPGSTQKIATTAAALETFGYDGLISKSYTCNGIYTTKYNQQIKVP